MKKAIALIALVGLFAVGGTATAELGTIDAVPAATLLLPYFEVNIEDRSVDTLFSVNNASAVPAIAHITVWSEFSVPVLDFDVYLTGYDVQTLSMYDIIASGILPQTGVAISNQGLFSQDNADNPNAGFYGNCTTGTSAGAIPIYNPIGGTFLAVVQAALTGEQIPAGSNAGSCASINGDGVVARGYVTIDSVTICSQEFPSNDTYFENGGTGTANNDNVLWGDWFWVNDAENFAFGETLVHIEADASITGCTDSQANPQTFYCRYTSDESGSDNREPLGAGWASRYLNGGIFDGGTALITYRDPGVAGSTDKCGDTPFFLDQQQIIVFDEEENPITTEEGPSGFIPAEEQPFPLETNFTVVGQDLTTPFDFGWVYVDFDYALADGNQDQAYMAVAMSALGRFTVGFDAMQVPELID